MKKKFNIFLFLSLVILLFGVLWGVVSLQGYDAAEEVPETPIIVKDDLREEISVSQSSQTTNLFTDGEMEMMAKVLYAEARGVESKMEQAAVVWVILNRLDTGAWGHTIEDVVTYPNAVAYYESTPVNPTMMDIVIGVTTTYSKEKQGLPVVGRVIPKDYLYFTGDGERNHFTREWGSSEEWDWSLPNPYSR